MKTKRAATRITYEVHVVARCLEPVWCWQTCLKRTASGRLFFYFFLPLTWAHPCTTRDAHKALKKYPCVTKTNSVHPACPASLRRRRRTGAWRWRNRHSVWRSSRATPSLLGSVCPSCGQTSTRIAYDWPRLWTNSFPSDLCDVFPYRHIRNTRRGIGKGDRGLKGSTLPARPHWE